MGDCLATIGRAKKVGAAMPLSMGEMGPHLKPWFHVKIKFFKIILFHFRRGSMMK